MTNVIFKELKKYGLCLYKNNLMFIPYADGSVFVQVSLKTKSEIVLLFNYVLLLYVCLCSTHCVWNEKC